MHVAGFLLWEPRVVPIEDPVVGIGAVLVGDPSRLPHATPAMVVEQTADGSRCATSSLVRLRGGEVTNSTYDVLG